MQPEFSRNCCSQACPGQGWGSSAQAGHSERPTETRGVKATVGTPGCCPSGHWWRSETRAVFQQLLRVPLAQLLAGQHLAHGVTSSGRRKPAPALGPGASPTGWRLDLQPAIGSKDRPRGACGQSVPWAEVGGIEGGWPHLPDGSQNQTLTRDTFKVMSHNTRNLFLSWRKKTLFYVLA